MKRYVLIPDSFKGTISSVEICRIVSEAIRAQDPEAAICAIPVADGGEGTVDAFLAALGGEYVEMICKEPYGKDMSARRYSRDRNGYGRRPAVSWRSPESREDYHLWRRADDCTRVAQWCKEDCIGLGRQCYQ